MSELTGGLDGTNIKMRTGALQATELLYCSKSCLFLADVEPDYPARVEVREELQVVPDPPPVPPRQISVEGEGDNSLPVSSPRTGRTAQVPAPIW